MSTTSIRDWIEYDGKNYIIDDTNNVYELTQVTGALEKDILDAIEDDSVEIMDTSSDNSTGIASNTDIITSTTPVNTVSKSGKRWSNEDLDTLKQLFTNGNTISQISEVLDRTSGGIFSKLQHLDLINKMERLDSYEKREQKKPAIPLPNFTKIVTDKIEKKPVINPIPIEPKKKTLDPLTPNQLEAFELFLSGQSFCLTGPGGTGKSHIIKHIVENCQTSNISCAITAMTGVAASLISGQTLHKWSGLGLMDRRIETQVGFMCNH